MRDALFDEHGDADIEGSDQVVPTHDEMNASIRNDGEIGIAIVVALCVELVEHEDGEVVVNVRE